MVQFYINFLITGIVLAIILPSGLMVLAYFDLFHNPEWMLRFKAKGEIKANEGDRQIIAECPVFLAKGIPEIEGQLLAYSLVSNIGESFSVSSEKLAEYRVSSKGYWSGLSVGLATGMHATISEQNVSNTDISSLLILFGDQFFGKIQGDTVHLITNDWSPLNSDSDSFIPRISDISAHSPIALLSK